MTRDIPLPSKDTRNDISWKLIMNRYGRPVLSPNYQTDIHVSERSVDKELLDKMVPEAHASHDTDTDTDNNPNETGYNTQNTELVNNNWHEVMRKHRYKKSIRNRDYGQIVSEMDNFEAPRTDRTVKTDGCTSPVEDIRPEGGPTEGLAKGGLQLLESMERGDRCVKRHKSKKRYRTGWRSGQRRKLLSARLRPWAGRSPQMLNDSVPHETGRIPPVIEEPMHYEWIGRKSGMNADLPVPQNYLETPNQILPSGFLKLAEEARHSEGVDDQSLGMNSVQSQHSGRTGRILIMEIEDSPPESGSEDSGGSRTSFEVIKDCTIEKPVIRLDPMGQDIRGLGYTDVIAKPDPVGPYKDRDFSVSRMTDGPAGLVRIRHPEGSYEDRDISAPPVTDRPAGLVRTRRPVGLYEDRDISVSPVTDGPAGLVRIRHPEGSYEDRDVSAPPVTDRPAGLVRTRRPVGLYEDRDISVSRMTDGPAGLVRIRHPEGSYEEREISVSPMTEEALRGRICPSVVMKTMEPSKVKFSPEVLTNVSEGSLITSSGIPDPVIRTVSDNRTNIMKLDRIKEQRDLSAVSPSSDSGVHSVDGEWDCMSTYSGESDSIQSVKTVYGGVCQTDRPVVKLETMDSKGVMDTLEGQYGDQGSVPSVSTNGHKSDIADMGDFSDEEEEQWEEIEPPKVVHTNVRTEFVVIDHRSSLSTIGHNSDIADMGDFSDEDNELWDDVEKSDDVQTEVRTDGVDSNSCVRSELAQKPTVVIPHCMEIHDEEYWTNFRFQAKQAFKLDNVALAASDFPIAVKELVVTSRATMDDINDRAERQYEEEEEWKMAGKTVKPSFFYSVTDRLEDFSIPVSDWCRKESPFVDEEATKTGFGPVTGSEEKRNKYKLTDSGDNFRDPDARARSELSQAKSAIAMGYTFNDDDGAIGIGGNMTGDAVVGDNEYIRVSMISVNEHRTVQSDFEHDSLGIRDCALPECGTQPMLAAYEDLTVCVRESLLSVATSCFGLCGLTDQFHHADFEWCMGRGWVKPQSGDEASVWPGNMFPEISGLESGPAVRTGPLGSHEDWKISGLESGPAVRTGPLGSHEDWRNVHPDRVYCRLVSVKGALIPYGHFDQPPALWQYMCVCYYIFSFLAAIVGMSSPRFLRAISEKDFDRLYDLPTGIHDVMGLQAVRPSSAVCKVMSVPDSNYVRVITPDEHVPTGFHKILIGMSQPDSVTRKVKDTRRVQTRDVKDVAPPGPNVVPESIPLSAQIPVKETVCTPTTHDRPVRVPLDEIPPAEDVMFDPMLGEWPVDTLSSPEEGTQKMTDGGKPCRPKPAAHPVSLVRKPPPKVTPSGTKPYGLRTRDKLVPKLKGRPIDGWEFEPLIHERPAHSGAEDESIENKLVEDTESSARPADRELKTDRSDRQPGNDTTSTGNLVDRQVPSITEDGQTQEEPMIRRLRPSRAIMKYAGTVYDYDSCCSIRRLRPSRAIMRCSGTMCAEH